MSKKRNTKPVKQYYRRNLPHFQADRKPLFVTFSTKSRWILPEPVRQTVLNHCLYDNGTKLCVHGVVVMPDHVHMVFSILLDDDENPYGFAEIMNGIKGASAHSVNKALNRKGAVWEAESFDRVLRTHEDIRKKVEYICQNPIRKCLVETEDDYPWLWREWIEGEVQAKNP